ncbi:hypothetical protein [Streptomyces iconiensis]|uniref:Uncharacterized protein n=1 Tax=Streptomyces iconiensis TaxID=1384038 RepID=A0ABT7A3Q2_9ACTN|nr:hypothetical protein [Streptomyces iconiensis]MDJ1135921.1 hypothetical protein [Streptomyces iconiensis]
MTAHESQERPEQAVAGKPKPKPAPKTPMSELLASCAAAAAVSNPPADTASRTEEPTVPAQRPSSRAA